MNPTAENGQDSIAYALRPATGADVAFIHSLRVSGLREHVTRIWGWDEGERRTRFELQFAPGSYQVIVVDDRAVGALSVEWRATELFLSDIEIAPEWRGRGLGTAVLGDLLAEASRRGLAAGLQVLKGNPAQHLYERLGFAAVDESATHVAMRILPEPDRC